MKHVLTFLVLSLGVSYDAFGKIKDPKVYDNIFNSCMAQKSADVSYRDMTEYCACTSGEVVDTFDYGELALLELDMKNSNNEDQVVLANQKMRMIIRGCLNKVFN
ncbi:MAG: hypothetical protein O3C44_09140 [Proteobacteria bacterium]|nr:hypothetical protein [Pseudomonadota bacterium]